MRLKPFRLSDLDFFPDEAVLEGMHGLTLWRDDVPVMCGGTAPCPWGEELWIAVRQDATLSEKIAIGKVARRYVEAMLTFHAELFAHARLGNERWLRFLGLELQEISVDDDGVEYRKWMICREAAWLP